ncbi:MAG: alpha/beta hydrolase [Anaerolinea sp.]|nr:alpha/beta hydrolase [Anaerolinea sp.]
MSFGLLDTPFILSLAFYPRTASITDGDRVGAPHIHSGTIPVWNSPPEGDTPPDEVIGYRLYCATPTSPLIVYFHGNAEIAPDYDDIAQFYNQRVGVSLMVVDYRGFGWSTGSPSFSALIDDTEYVLKALPTIRTQYGIVPESPLYLMGRSMGSAPAIHIAFSHPEQVKGLIIESGFADLFSVLVRMGFPSEALGRMIDPLGNERKMETIHLPLLIIHGEDDNLIPFKHAQRLYDASPSTRKRLLRIVHAGHNDLMMQGLWDYFGAIADFVKPHEEKEESAT